MLDAGLNLQLALGFHTISAIVWLVCALSAYGSYRAFALRRDLIWTLGFLLLVLVAGSRSLQTLRVGNSLGTGGFGDSTAELFDRLWAYNMNVAAFEMVAAFLVFYAFRAKRPVAID